MKGNQFPWIVQSQFLQSITGIPHYTTLNSIVDSFDPIKIRPFDHGQVLVKKARYSLFVSFFDACVVS